jgi:hypothetical protein
MTRARWKSIGLLAGMFLLGGVSGAAVMRVVDDREMAEIMQVSPDEARVRFRMKAMARQLRLSPEQKRKGLEIFEKYRDKCGPSDREARQRKAECRRQAQDEIVQILTPEQRLKHERIAERRKKRKLQRKLQRKRRGRP